MSLKAHMKDVNDIQDQILNHLQTRISWTLRGHEYVKSSISVFSGDAHGRGKTTIDGDVFAIGRFQKRGDITYEYKGSIEHVAEQIAIHLKSSGCDAKNAS